MEPKDGPRTATPELKKERSAFDKAFDSVINWVERHNARQSAIGDKAIYHDQSLFPWTKTMEAACPDIRKELDQLLVYKDDLPAFHEISSEVSSITQDQDWKTFWLLAPGMEPEENRQRCPKTWEAVQSIPGLRTVMFSILAPGKHIPAHRGPYNGVLRYHLALMVPEEREKCRIRIDDQFYAWEEGKGIIFDDSYNHEVWNETDETRVVLFIDFERPLTGYAKILNKAVLGGAKYTPYLQEFKRNQARWEQDFAKKQQRRNRAA